MDETAPKGPEVTLAGDGLKWWQAGHPWIYRDDLTSIRAEPGDIVSVRDAEGRVRGHGFYSATSKIAVRALDHADSAPTVDTFRARFERAIELRRRWVREDDAHRLIFSEADGLPGLVVDRYADHLVVQTAIAGTERRIEEWAPILAELTGATCVIARNDSPVRKLEDLPVETRVLLGKPRSPLEVREGAIRLQVDLLQGQKTGAFLDQRENHIAAGELARGRVLDAFTYQGGFALQMARSAEHVLAIDSSQPALDALRENAVLNGLGNIEGVRAKVIPYLRSAVESGERFDTIVLDPPAFARTKRDRGGAERGYREINRRAIELLAPNGVLVSCSCSAAIGAGQFERILTQAAGAAGRSLQVLERRGPSRDHPSRLGLPESTYLKCFVLRALD
ncbi:MAG: class I SAM-dependent rRNA methyltransferase [Planctomycetota bacterium]